MGIPTLESEAQPHSRVSNDLRCETHRDYFSPIALLLTANIGTTPLAELPELPIARDSLCLCKDF